MALLQVPRSSSHATAIPSLTNRIRRQLSGSGWGTATLQIEDDGAAVTLRGIASSFYQRQVWLHRVKQVIGDGRYINDEISVGDPNPTSVLAAQ